MNPTYTDDEIIELFDERVYDKLLSYLDPMISEHESHSINNIYALESEQTLIMAALIILGKIEILNILFSKYNDQYNSNCLMYFIIKCNSTDILKIFLQVNLFSGLDYLNCDSTYVIAKNNYLELLKIIVEFGPDNSFFQKIISWSIFNSNVDILEYLFDIGRGSDIQSEFDIAVYQKMEYIRLNLMPMISLLIKNDIDIWKHLNQICVQAARSGDINLLEFCLQNGADSNYDNGIMIRLSCTCMKFAKYLLQHGADINFIKDTDLINLNRPITHENIIFLVENGLDISGMINKLFLYSVTAGADDLVLHFLDVGADIHAENELALFAAAYYGNVQTVRILLESGADIHARNDTICLFVFGGMDDDFENESICGWMMFRFCASNQNELFELLVKNGADISDISILVLMLTNQLIQIDKEVVEYFMTAGSDINATCQLTYEWAQKYNLSDYATSPLEASIFGGKANISQFLLENGADLTINSDRPARLAIMSGNIPIIKILSDHGAALDPDFEYTVCQTYPISYNGW